MITSILIPDCIYICLLAATVILGNKKFKKAGNIKPIILLSLILILTNLLAFHNKYVNQYSLPRYVELPFNLLYIYLIGLFFFKEFSKNSTKRVTVILTIINATTCLITTFPYKNFYFFSVVTINLIGTLTTLTLGTLLFIEMMDKYINDNLLKIPGFSITIGIIILNFNHFTINIIASFTDPIYLGANIYSFSLFMAFAPFYLLLFYSIFLLPSSELNS